MKKILPVMLLVCNLCVSQPKPIIKIASKDNVMGYADYKSVVFVEYKFAGNQIIDKDTVKNDNKFNVEFSKKPLPIGTIINVYYEKKSKDIDRAKDTIRSDEDVIKAISVRLASNQLNYEQQRTQINAYEAEKDALKNTTLVYKTTILSTNFSVPLVRFNFVKGDENKQGDILLFNSIGAGLGYYKGRLERTRDNTGEIVNEDFSNTIGINVGFLFSAGTGEDTKNVFAPVFNISVLDLQLGIGCELGSRAPNQKREFLTLSYAIPIYKLFRKGYRVYLDTNMPFESIHKTQN